ncbi:hypothetical protein J5N97_021472 [Dioscorea zingiberensis]|uniref:Uncharacterized protein n=1 Tax=Dioscorea zingiberensis TaxID=325984 RepID=A0A9D5CHP5_9LILI|nr:hypothetical protein J5N97_021472 [Dioscorea zingiberensis]
MLTASDFMLVLRWLQKNAATHSNEELASYTISDWKQFKLQHRNSVWPSTIHSSIMHHVTEKDCLKDLAVKIIQNEISSVPMLESSSSHNGSCVPLLIVVSLPDILKYISNRYPEANENSSPVTTTNFQNCYRNMAAIH